ncbi:PHB depolymerase family esterase [Janthinobacterium sp.]|uniref:extracellular catalytic domain type 2 short-chain-length polyhydroxyalkanoate depolymerase n=1 Tax=Janthinobacterium sp. TaxID=1871054 RepID=UPI0026304932|nr:PHB depolymerase family esterase [Janthinobacterium sp.]
MHGFSRLFVALACAATLSACGGGSGSGNAALPQQSSQTQSSSAVAGISGTVTLAGANTPLAGVTLTLASGVSTVSGADGSYAFKGLAAGSYTVTPSMQGLSAFSPGSLNVKLSSANVQGQSFAATSATPVSLGAYHADPAGVTVAGISSGGAMAVQLQVANSASFHGAAIFAGDPYYCNQNALSSWKTACANGGIPLATLTAYTDSMANSGLIDPTSNIGGKPIYMFSGTRDTVVAQQVMDQLQTYYQHYTSASNIVYNNTTPAQHSWITPDAASDCGHLGAPFMNNCNVNAEQTFLTMFYGKLHAPTATPQGSYAQINQNTFCAGNNCAAISMDNTAWLYVPDNCATQSCKVVVALHGCKQGQTYIGNTFVQQAGINEWADTNNILVLYPQAIASPAQPRNPEGCWDWWGYTGADYALKSAPQMTAIMAMVHQITAAP